MSNKSVIEIIREWAEEKQKESEIGYHFYQELLDKLAEVEKELASRPVESVEGYLEGKYWQRLREDGEPVRELYLDTALAALQALERNKDAEIADKELQYDWACGEINKWRKNGEEGWQLAERLTAEVDRLKGGGWISVEDRLPEVNTLVLGYFPDKDESGLHVNTAIRYDGYEYLMSAAGNSTAAWFKPTHWQPLPPNPQL